MDEVRGQAEGVRLAFLDSCFREQPIPLPLFKRIVEDNDLRVVTRVL